LAVDEQELVEGGVRPTSLIADETVLLYRFGADDNYFVMEIVDIPADLLIM